MQPTVRVRVLVSMIVLAWVLGAAEAWAQQNGPGCSVATLNGTYGSQMQGTRPIPPPGGPGMESVIGVVVRTYDGMGNVTQVDNVKGAMSGIIPNRPGTGTYQVNADCTAEVVFEPGPGITIVERMVIVEGGAEILSITVSPAEVMVTAVQKRITATPTPPPTQPAVPCPGPDPFAAIPTLVGECIDGGWVPRVIGG
jgi:hypothetical protein